MKLQYFTEQNRGSERKVLFEIENKNGMMEGYSDNYIRIMIPFKQEWANNVVEWII